MKMLIHVSTPLGGYIPGCDAMPLRASHGSLNRFRYIRHDLRCRREQTEAARDHHIAEGGGEVGAQVTIDHTCTPRHLRPGQVCARRFAKQIECCEEGAPADEAISAPAFDPSYTIFFVVFCLYDTSYSNSSSTNHPRISSRKFFRSDRYIDAHAYRFIHWQCCSTHFAGTVRRYEYPLGHFNFPDTRIAIE